MKKITYLLMVAVSTMGAATGWAQEEEMIEETVVETTPVELQPTSIPADMVAEMQDLYEQLQVVSERLSSIQDQAFEREDVTEALEAFEKQLREKMISIDPASEKTIEEIEVLIEELSAVDAPDTLGEEELEALHKKYEEYQTKAYSLQSVEQGAREDEAIIAAQEKIQKIVLDAMTAIDPGTSALIQQHEDLVDRFMELEEKNMGDIMGGQMMEMPEVEIESDLDTPSTDRPEGEVEVEVDVEGEAPVAP